MEKPWQKQKIDGVLLDVTGVLINGHEAIPGSVEAFKELCNSGIPVRLVTNESVSSVDKFLNILESAGYTNFLKSQIFSPAPAVCRFLKENNLRPHLLVHPDVLPDFCDVNTSEPNCVVMGDAENSFSYQNLNNAFRKLMEMEKPLLIAMGQGKYYSNTDGLNLDVGAFKAALEFACDIKARVIGKPSSDFFECAVKDLKTCPENVVMVGDDIKYDIGGAQACKIRGLLVRTGKYRPCNENDPVVKPDDIVDDLAEAVKKILAVYQRFRGENQ
ncbi:LHPP (predicted) [Pycnogonum litorale]